MAQREEERKSVDSGDWLLLRFAFLKFFVFLICGAVVLEV